MISAVVNSYNEAEKLDKCLNSVKGWADEILVINMESDDNTEEVAKKYNAKIINHKRINYVEPIRKFAVDHAKGPWIMILDPDEVVIDNLKKQLKEISETGDYDAVRIPRLNFIFGEKIKHTNFWPDYHIRFIKKGSVEFSNLIHSYPEVKGDVLTLSEKEENAIYHYPYKTILEYWQRMKRYSDVESQNLHHQDKHFSLLNLFSKPCYDFMRRYFRHLGFLDGWRGLLLSIFQAYYYILVEIKLLKLDLK